MTMAGKCRFLFGPWNIHEGADPFGPTVRSSITPAKKLKMCKKLGFDGVQSHDDDAVPDMNKLRPKDIAKAAKEVSKALSDEGLTAEFVAPRLWGDRRTIDGGYTSNDPEAREYAREHSRRAIDIAVALNTKLIVLCLAREGTLQWALRRDATWRQIDGCGCACAQYGCSRFAPAGLRVH